jgi:hypothetical protein
MTRATALILTALAIGTVANVVALAAEQRSFTDARGYFAGSSITRSNATSYYDSHGRFVGSATRR